MSYSLQTFTVVTEAQNEKKLHPICKQLKEDLTSVNLP